MCYVFIHYSSKYLQCLRVECEIVYSKFNIIFNFVKFRTAIRMDG